MLRYAWAYQGSSTVIGGFPYPVQSINTRIQNQRPATRLARRICQVAIRSRAPITHTQPGELYIFSRT